MLISVHYLIQKIFFLKLHWYCFYFMEILHNNQRCIHKFDSQKNISLKIESRIWFQKIQNINIYFCLLMMFVRLNVEVDIVQLNIGNAWSGFSDKIDKDDFADGGINLTDNAADFNFQFNSCIRLVGINLRSSISSWTEVPESWIAWSDRPLNLWLFWHLTLRKLLCKSLLLAVQYVVPFC